MRRAACVLLVTLAPWSAPGQGLPFELAASSSRAPDVCMRIVGDQHETCGGLDDDGLLPLKMPASPGARVLLDGAPRSGVVRLDLLVLLGRLSAQAVAARGGDPLGWLVFDLEDGTSVKVVPILSDLAHDRLVARLAAAAGSANGWAAAYRPSDTATHPLLAFTLWRGRQAHDDLGRPLGSLVTPGQPALGEIELLATIDVDPRSLGRCPRCSVDDFGWPEIEFRCQRLRLDSEVEVYAARTGTLVARRRFRGPPPAACQENMQHLMARGALPDVTRWLEALASPPGRPEPAAP